MRTPAALCIPLLAMTLALAACAPDAEAAECEQLDAVIAAHDAADAAVPEPGSSLDPEANLPLYDGLLVLAQETAAAATDAIPQVQDPERLADLEEVLEAAGALESASQAAISLVESGEDTASFDSRTSPGFVRLDLTGAMSSIQLDPCHF